MTYSTIYYLDGYIATDGVQSQAVDATIQTARRIAADAKRSVVVEDRGTGECYCVTPAGHRRCAPKGWTPSWQSEEG